MTVHVKRLHERRHPVLIRCGWAAALLTLAWTGSTIALNTASGTPESRAGQILAAQPAAPPDEQAAWIARRARTERDARLARALWQQLPASASAAWKLSATLWQVRYAMARGDRSGATRLLVATPPPAAGDSLHTEWCYWNRLLGQNLRAGGAPDAPVAEGDRWALGAQLVALTPPLEARPEMRTALGLEGAVRRHGWLGPWLWRLTGSSRASLRRTAADVYTIAAGALSRAPEQWALAQRVHAVPGGEAVGGAGRVPQLLPAELERRRPPPAARRGSGGRFVVLVSTVEQEHEARELVSELAHHGFRGRVVPDSAGGAPSLFRVILGEGASLARAESLGTRLQRRLLLPYRIVEEP